MQVLHPPKKLPTGALGCSCRQQFSTSSFLCHVPVSDRRHLGVAYGRCACAAPGTMCSDSGGDGKAAPRQTPTHVFEEGDRVGKGGSCDVFCGIEKDTGKRHALKVLREHSPGQQSQLLQEAETLAKLSHPKIVRYFGQNFEVETGRPVMILEFCSGGSLHSFLQQPENAHGLDDDDFRTLLGDLVEGLSFLQGKGIVHRDIKPGNILRHLHNNGKCVYKLSDFGTCREATDTDQMTSIVGTEEYLHPVLYKSAFFGNKTHSPINLISGELWSLGCTLYHAMTASVPFRPLGGARNNRKAMFVMISQKPPGTISGTQRMDGTFRWESAPPSDCRMSESLRQKVTPLLQSLLETDTSRQWTFSTFLDESRRILGMRRLHVCDTECGELFRLYMEPKQSLAELQDSLAYHTEVPAGQQLLFHRGQPLLNLLGPRVLVRDLPSTRGDQHLLLCPRRAVEGRCRRQVAAQPQLLVAEATLEEDVTSAFRACSDLYTHLTMALTLRQLPSLLFSAIMALRNTVTSNQSTVETRFRVVSAACQERQIRMAIITQVMDTLPLSSSSSSSTSPSSSSSSSYSPHSKLDEARKRCDQLRDRLWQLKYRLDEFRRGAESVRFESLLSESLCQDESCEAVKHLFRTAKDVWQKMQERRQRVPLSQVHQDKHKGDSTTLNQTCVESMKRVKALQSARLTLLEQYRHHVSQLYDRLEDVQGMDLELQKLKEDSEEFSTLLEQIWKTGWEDNGKMTEDSRLAPPVHSSKPLKEQLGELISEGLPVLETFNLTPTTDGKK